MAIELKMPALSPTMEKGTLAKWLVAVGDKVEPGDLLAEIETDKATMEFEAIDEGVVAAILVAEGTEEVSVGATIALLSEQGDAASADRPPVAEAPFKSEVPTAVAIEAPPVSTDPAKPPAAKAAVPVAADPARVNATPLAQRIAAAENIALSWITGRGPRGRIMKADLGLPSRVAAIAADRSPAPPQPAIATHAPPSGIPFEAVKLSGMRKTIARRLSESKQTVPHFYLTSHIRIDDLLRFRGELNASLPDHAARISVNDLIIKATAMAMAAEPDVNVQFDGDQIYRFGRVDIAMAVAIEGGLVTPVIRDVTSLSLSSIAGHSKRLAARARDGKLVPEDYQGGTASVSNLGMFGIDEIIPVINPPQALIVGVGSGVEKPWNLGGTIGLATIMTATASFDHRAIDGAAGARFMAVLREHIERPLLLVA